jgi:hypothetical protein
MGEPAIRTRRWTRQEYDRLIELGVLHEDEPVELLDGRLVVREPQRTPHTVATQLVEEALRAAFGTGGWSVRVQLMRSHRSPHREHGSSSPTCCPRPTRRAPFGRPPESPA